MSSGCRAFLALVDLSRRAVNCPQKWKAGFLTEEYGDLEDNPKSIK